jgi:Legionella pneumophila major outer membrane protein precursor
MKSYNKIAGAILALGIGSGAHAATYEKVPPVAECMGENVTVPCEQRGWHVGAQYMYVQPTGDQLYSDLTSQSRWASGFRLEAGYHFGTGNDVTVNWTYFSKASRRNVVPFNNPLLANNQLIGGDPESFAQLYGTGPFAVSERVKSTFNAVNLEFGQMAHWGERVSTRFYVGLQYASIQRDRTHLDFAINGVVPQEGIFVERRGFNSASVNFEQKFDGIGPRVGIDAYYTFGDSKLSLVGKAAAAVLAADTRVRNGAGRVVNIRETLLNDTLYTRTTIEVDITTPNARTRTLTLGLEAKLGIEYAWPLATGDLIFEGGYQWVAYPQSMLAPSAVKTQETYTFEAPQTPTIREQFAPRLFGLGFPGELNNFGYHGFYVGLRWAGDLA